jgi:hypothetical protein
VAIVAYRMEKEKVSHALVAGGPNRRSVSESRERGGMQLTDKSMIKSETNRCYRADKKKKEKRTIFGQSHPRVVAEGKTFARSKLKFQGSKQNLI